MYRISNPRKLTLLFLVLLGCDSRSSNQRETPTRYSHFVWETVLFSDTEENSLSNAKQIVNEDTLECLIVTNFHAAGGGGGTGHDSQEAIFHGGWYLPDGKTEIKFEGRTSQGVLKDVTIGEESFALSEGRVFLIGLDKVLTVRQLDRDTRTVRPDLRDSSAIESFLEKIPEFQDFKKGKKSDE